MYTKQNTFYSTSNDGSILVSDNYASEDKQGREIFIEVSPESNVVVGSLGLFDIGADARIASLNREEATKLRDYLNKWLGD